MHTFIKTLALISILAGCDVVDNGFEAASQVGVQQEENNPCPAVFDCMTNACTYQSNADASRAAGYVAGCVEACMGANSVTEADAWVRGVAGSAFVACETDQDNCESKMRECVDG